MKNRIGYLYVIITCFIWGSVYIASKYALASIGPLTVLCIRYLVAGACLAVLLNMRRTRRTVKKGDWKYIWIVGGLGYFVSITFQLVGTKLLDASLASLINGMNPITISLLAAVFLKEKIHKTSYCQHLHFNCRSLYHPGSGGRVSERGRAGGCPYLHGSMRHIGIGQDTANIHRVRCPCMYLSGGSGNCGGPYTLEHGA